jgi:hypothetical protein
MRRSKESLRKALSKAHQHTAHFARAIDEFLPSRVGYEPEIPRQLDVRGKFVSGAKRNVDEAGHIAIAPPAAPFGDVGRNRHRGPSGLVHQAEPFRSRIRGRCPVHQHREVLRLLPHLELPEVVHTSSIRSTKLFVKTPASNRRTRGCRSGQGQSQVSAYCLLMAAYS